MPCFSLVRVAVALGVSLIDALAFYNTAYGETALLGFLRGKGFDDLSVNIKTGRVVITWRAGQTRKTVNISSNGVTARYNTTLTDDEKAALDSHIKYAANREKLGRIAGILSNNGFDADAESIRTNPKTGAIMLTVSK